MTGRRLIILGLGLTLKTARKSHRLYPAGDQQNQDKQVLDISDIRIAYLTCI